MDQAMEQYNRAQGRKPFRFTLMDAGIVFSCFILVNFALSLTVELVLMLMGKNPSFELEHNANLNWGLQIGLHVLLLLVSVVYYKVKKGGLDAAMLKRKIRGKDLFYSLCLMLAMFTLANAITNIVVAFLEAFGYRQGRGVMIDSWFSFVMALFGVVILPAFSEELVFRGIIMKGLKRYGKSAAIFGSALLFGVMHMNVVQLIYAFQCGILLALVVYKTDNIKYGIIMHGLSNLISVVVTFATSGMNPADMENSPAIIILSLLLFVLAVVGLILGLTYFLKRRPREAWEQEPPRPVPVCGAPFLVQTPYGAYPPAGYPGSVPPPYVNPVPPYQGAPTRPSPDAAQPTLSPEERAGQANASAGNAPNAASPVSANAEGNNGENAAAGPQSGVNQTPPVGSGQPMPPTYPQGNAGATPPPYGQPVYPQSYPGPQGGAWGAPNPYAGQAPYYPQGNAANPPPYANGQPVPPPYPGMPAGQQGGAFQGGNQPMQPQGWNGQPVYPQPMPYYGPAAPQPMPYGMPMVQDPEKAERKRDFQLGLALSLPGLLLCVLMILVDLFV